MSTTPAPVKEMLSVSKTSDGKTLVKINPSSLTTLQTCPRKSMYNLDQELVSKSPAFGLVAGSAVHQALEEWYLCPRDLRSLPPDFEENLQLMANGHQIEDESSKVIYRANRRLIDYAGPLADLPGDDKRSIPNLCWLWGEYCKSRYLDPYVAYQGAGVKMVEQRLEHDLYEDDELKVILFGTVDAILLNEANGQLVVCDHKTTSATHMNSFYNRTKPNHQYTAYIYLAQQCLGVDTDNFLINVFQIKARPKTPKGSGPNFLTIPTKRSVEDIEEMKKTVVYYVRQYLHWKETNFWPLGPVDACANYGKCNFLEVCESPEVIRDNILSANYRNKHETN